jgi:hypothetical protein
MNHIGTKMNIYNVLNEDMRDSEVSTYRRIRQETDSNMRLAGLQYKEEQKNKKIAEDRRNKETRESLEKQMREERQKRDKKKEKRLAKHKK